MKITNTALIDRAIFWFKDYAQRVKKITSGNISHDTNRICGFLNACAEFIEIHRNDEIIYTQNDLQEFAEWCSLNSWFYSSFTKEWGNLGGVKKTTSQLREQWEIETGRRKP